MGRLERLGAALALVAAAGCGDGGSDAGPAEADANGARRNVVIVVVDTLRADRLGCYGADRPTSPNIDALAARGVRFANTQSVAPWTMPSVATMFTGLFPAAHGVTDPTRMLPPEAYTLAEFFGDQGYSTGGVVSHGLIGTKYDYTQGFEYFDESNAKGHAHVSTASVSDLAQEMLVEFTEREEPFFLFVHYFDPHYDYVPHDEFDFAADSGGRIEGAPSIHDLRVMMDTFTDEELGYLRDVYDEEIAHTDAGIGQLFATLDELGVSDDTVVLFTSDHGEEFVEHGWLGHTRSMYQPVLHVPLIVAAPGDGLAGAVVEFPTSTVSVAPTVVELAGLSTDGLGYQGASLAPIVRGDATEHDTPVVAQVEFLPLRPDGFVRRSFQRSLVEGRFKLLRDEDLGTTELFDLAADPGERAPVTDAHRVTLDAMLARMDAALERFGATPLPLVRRELGPALMRQLELLGYVGSGGDGEDGRTPDDAADDDAGDDASDDAANGNE